MLRSRLYGKLDRRLLSPSDETENEVPGREFSYPNYIKGLCGQFLPFKRNNDCYERCFTHSVNYALLFAIYHSRGTVRGTAIHNYGTAPVDYDPAIDSPACQRQ